jgi:hypothetical protein
VSPLQQQQYELFLSMGWEYSHTEANGDIVVEHWTRGSRLTNSHIIKADSDATKKEGGAS